jgi:hypothetical protein
VAQTQAGQSGCVLWLLWGLRRPGKEPLPQVVCCALFCGRIAATCRPPQRAACPCQCVLQPRRATAVARAVHSVLYARDRVRVSTPLSISWPVGGVVGPGLHTGGQQQQQQQHRVAQAELHAPSPTHTHSDLLHGSPSCWAGRRMWSSDACPCAPTFARTGGVRCTPHGWLPTAANPQQHLSPSIWCKLQQLVCVVAAQVWRACACPLSPPSCLPVWLGTRGSSQQHSRYLAPVAVGRSVCACWGPACLWLAVPG